MIKKTGITLFISVSLAVCVSGQVTDAEKHLRAVSADTTLGWKKGGIFSVTLSQTALKNWAAGGQNSVAVNGIFSLFANLRGEKSSWDNSLDLGYGIMKQGKNEDFRKTDDKIDFLSKYGRQAFGKFKYAARLNFKTQMQPGYNYIDNDNKNKISDFLSPGYLTLAQKLVEEGDAWAEGWNFGPADSDAKTVAWVVEQLATAWGPDARWAVAAEAQVHEARILKLDCGKARARLGWHPRWDLDKALDSIIEWTQSYRSGDNLQKVCLGQIAEFTGAST